MANAEHTKEDHAELMRLRTRSAAMGVKPVDNWGVNTDEFIAADMLRRAAAFAGMLEPEMVRPADPMAGYIAELDRQLASFEE